MRRIAEVAIGVMAVASVFAIPAAAQDACSQEAASIRKAQRDLPRLDVAPPGDQQIVCITLETNIVFARRFAAHIAKCPRSPLARESDGWRRTNTDYTAQFGGRRCKPTIRGFNV